jgi:hypothetical protein
MDLGCGRLWLWIFTLRSITDGWPDRRINNKGRPVAARRQGLLNSGSHSFVPPQDVRINLEHGTIVHCVSGAIIAILSPRSRVRVHLPSFFFLLRRTKIRHQNPIQTHLSFFPIEIQIDSRRSRDLTSLIRLTPYM